MQVSLVKSQILREQRLSILAQKKVSSKNRAPTTGAEMLSSFAGFELVLGKLYVRSIYHTLNFVSYPTESNAPP